MKPDQVDRLLATLKAALPHADGAIDVEQVTARDAVYRQTMLGWHAKTAEEAVQACLLRGRFYPTLAELYEAYSAANRARPELVAISNAIPKPGETVASPEEVKAACAEAIAKVSANVVMTPEHARLSREPRAASPAPGASAREEKRMIERTLKQGNRRGK